jgi:hypothetical protein
VSPDVAARTGFTDANGVHREWARPDRATLSEFHKIKKKAKLLGRASVTPDEIEMCRRYVEHERRLIREAQQAKRICSRLPQRQQRQFRHWTPREFLAYKRCARTPRASYVARPRTQQTRRVAAPTRGSPSPGDDESPERPLGAWAYLALASERMHVHERRREARWRRRVAA